MGHVLCGGESVRSAGRAGEERRAESGILGRWTPRASERCAWSWRSARPWCWRALLIYTSFSAASPALTPTQLVHQAQPGRSYQVTGTVVQGSVHRVGEILHFSVEDRAGGHDPPQLHGDRARPLPRRARGDRHRPEAGRRLRRRTQLADHEVPVEVQVLPQRAAELLSDSASGARETLGSRRLMAGFGFAACCWRSSCASTGSPPRSTGCAAAPGVLRLRAARGVRAGGRAHSSLRRARDRLPAQRLHLPHRRGHLQPHDADVLPGGRHLVLAGRLAAAVGVAALAVVQPRAVPHARAHARGRPPTPPPSCSASPASSSA